MRKTEASTDDNTGTRLPIGRIAGLIAIAGFAVAALTFDLLQPLDNWLTDRRFELSSRPATGSVIFVEIDPASLRQIGVWPWPRHVYGELIDKLMALGADDTILDIDLSSASSEAEDAALESALRGAGGYVQLAAFRQFSPAFGKIETTLPLPRFRAVADPVVVNVVAAADGIVRAYATGMEAGGHTYPSLAEALSGSKLRKDTSFFIDYGINAATVDRISVADLMADRVDPGRIAGKQVVVGASAQELRDIFTVPRFGTVPGSMLQILGAETLKQHRALHFVDIGVPLGLVLAFGLFFAIAGRRIAFPGVALAGTIAIVGTEGAAFYLQAEQGLLLRTAAPVLAIIGLMLTSAILELAEKRRLHKIASRERDNMRRILDRVISDNFDGIVVVDESDRILASSQLAGSFLGSGADLAGKLAGAVLPRGLHVAVREMLSDGDADQDIRPAVCAIASGGGPATQWIEYVVTRSEVESRGRGTNPHIACLTFRDITDRRRHEEQLAFLASHDPLTGILSRPAFVERVDAHLADTKTAGVTLILLDLGRFRTINDTLGHAFGDLVLKEISRRLSEFDLLALSRVGGDTFALACRGTLGAEKASAFAKSILERVTDPFCFDDRRAVLVANAGVTTSVVSGRDGETLISHADMALSLAKEIPGNAVALFEPALDLRLQEKQRMEAALRQALRNGEFEVHYQPQVDLVTHKLVGVEALLRWQHPAMGSISPADFIPAAEENGLIVDIGRFVLETACRDAARWDRSVRLAVNISPVQFELGDVERDVRAALERSGLAPNRLDVEITEGIFVDSGHPTTRILSSLRELGIGVALDDFGTGYSALGYLGRLPIDKLKIDKSFINRLPGDPEASAIVSAVLSLSGSLGLPVVAEGIESPEQADLLARLGCTIGQGYLYGKAASLNDLERAMASRSAWGTCENPARAQPAA